MHMTESVLKEIIVEQAKQIKELRETLHNAEMAQDFWRKECEKAEKGAVSGDSIYK